MPAQSTPTRRDRVRKPILAISLAVAGTAIAASPGVAAASSCPNTIQMPGAISTADFEQATICLVNEERTSRGLVALQENSHLDSAAAGHSAEMGQQSYFAHDSAGGAPFEDRIFASGYVSPNQPGVHWEVGENLAWGSLQLGTAQAIDAAWMNSPEHRAILLNPDYREIGAATVSGSPKDPAGAGMIVTQDFGVIDRANSSNRKCKTGSRIKRKRCARRLAARASR